MIFNVSGGGGTALNFRVVGNPKPSAAKENTIWIDTDVPITSYIFSATQPTGVPGMVWISTDTSSPVAFNALKKNGIMVYPLSAKQYVSGAWVHKTAKSYQGGEWVVLWNGDLYDAGNQYTAITGGWEQNSNMTFKNYSNDATITFGNENIQLNAASGEGAIVSTKNKIDVACFSTIKFNVTRYNYDTMDAYGIVDDRGNVFDNAVAKKYDTIGNLGTKITISVDISAITQGSYYVFVAVANERRIDVHKIWLE